MTKGISFVVCNFQVVLDFPVIYLLQSEVNLIGRLSHPNIIKLLGYCREDNELLLVYEFLQQGSLKKHLFGSQTINLPY